MLNTPVKNVPALSDDIGALIEADTSYAASLYRAYMKVLTHTLRRVKALDPNTLAPADQKKVESCLALVEPAMGQAEESWIQGHRKEAVLALQRAVYTLNTIDLPADQSGARVTALSPAEQQRVVRDEMNPFVEGALVPLEKGVIKFLRTPEGSLSLKANFHEEAQAAAVNVEKIIANLRVMQTKGWIVPNFTLPPSMPCLQGFESGHVVIWVHPVDFCTQSIDTAASMLMHEGSHAFDPTGIVDLVYRKTSLHQLLPGPLALKNAANYEQFALDVLDPLHSAVQYVQASPNTMEALCLTTVRVARSWVVCYNYRQPFNPGGSVRSGFIQDVVLQLAGLLDTPFALAPGKSALGIDQQVFVDCFAAMGAVMDVANKMQVLSSLDVPPDSIRIEQGGAGPLCLVGRAAAELPADEQALMILTQIVNFAIDSGQTRYFGDGTLMGICLDIADMDLRSIRPLIKKFLGSGSSASRKDK